MPSGVLAWVLAAVAIAQGRSPSPPVTPLRSLPITQGPVTFVNPNSPCPAHKGAPVRLGSVILQPPLLHYTPPRKASSTGRVIVEATIEPDGRVGQVKALRGPTDLHDLALEAVRQWRYARACLNGSAIRLIVVVTVTFPAHAGV